MKLLILYGPPGAGKLTVATELARLSGFKLLHNHLTIELAKALFEFGSEPYVRYLRELRLHALEVAAREGLAGVVTTFVYTPPTSDAFLRALLDVCARRGVQTCFAQLLPSEAALLARIGQDGRRDWSKVAQPDTLAWYLTLGRATEPIPFVDSFHLDNTTLSPAEAARRVAAHYGLT